MIKKLFRISCQVLMTDYDLLVGFWVELPYIWINGSSWEKSSREYIVEPKHNVYNNLGEIFTFEDIKPGEHTNLYIFDFSNTECSPIIKNYFKVYTKTDCLNLDVLRYVAAPIKFLTEGCKEPEDIFNQIPEMISESSTSSIDEIIMELSDEREKIIHLLKKVKIINPDLPLKKLVDEFAYNEALDEEIGMTFEVPEYKQELDKMLKQDSRLRKYLEKRPSERSKLKKPDSLKEYKFLKSRIDNVITPKERKEILNEKKASIREQIKHDVDEYFDKERKILNMEIEKRIEQLLSEKQVKDYVDLLDESDKIWYKKPLKNINRLQKTKLISRYEELIKASEKRLLSDQEETELKGYESNKKIAKYKSLKKLVERLEIVEGQLSSLGGNKDVILYKELLEKLAEKPPKKKATDELKKMVLLNHLKKMHLSLMEWVVFLGEEENEPIEDFIEEDETEEEGSSIQDDETEEESETGGDESSDGEEITMEESEDISLGSDEESEDISLGSDEESE